MINLTVTKEEIQTIMNALGELPAKLTVNLLLKINEQFKKQMEEKECPANSVKSDKKK